MLTLKGLTKSFNGKPVLKGINCSVRNGEIAFFLGSSGTGKSTLLRMMNNLEKPDAGTITLDGAVVEPADLIKKHQVGMVFQHFNLFEHLTVERNITLILEKALGMSVADARKRAQELLTAYGLYDKKDVRISQLSGGQKQRVALARTLAIGPRIICLDEPTSALDPLLTSYVAQEIQKLAAAGYTVLVASHDTLLLEKVTCTIYLMQQGEIVETVSSQEFDRNRAAYPRIDAFVAGNHLQDL